MYSTCQWFILDSGEEKKAGEKRKREYPLYLSLVSASLKDFRRQRVTEDRHEDLTETATVCSHAMVLPCIWGAGKRRRRRENGTYPL